MVQASVPRSKAGVYYLLLVGLLLVVLVVVVLVALLVGRVFFFLVLLLLILLLLLLVLVGGAILLLLFILLNLIESALFILLGLEFTLRAWLSQKVDFSMHQTPDLVLGAELAADRLTAVALGPHGAVMGRLSSIARHLDDW